MDIGERIRELLAINHAIASATDYDEVLRLVVERTYEFTRADACLVLLLVDARSVRVAAAVGEGMEAACEVRLPLDEELGAGLGRVLGFRDSDAFFGVPIVGSAGLIGVLAILRRCPGDGDRVEDEELLSALADQAAIALENADRLRRLEAAFDAVHAERQVLSQVMEAAPVALLLVEGDEARISYANRSALELFPGADDLSLEKWTTRGDADAGFERSLVRRALVFGEQVRGVEVVEEQADGGERHFEVSAAPLPPGEGGKRRAVIAVQDTTLREHLRREREHAGALAEAIRVKDLFFNTLSHELRSPIAAIRNAVELIRRSSANPTRRERACAIIERSVSNQTRLIDDLLDLSRIMLGRLRLEHELVDLQDLVAVQVEALEQDARRKGLEMSLETGAGALPVRGDRVRLGQVVSNLLTNAIRYTAHGSIRVRVFAEGKQVAVQVQDTGIGIAAETLEHIFQPFRATDSSLQRSSGGLGIGLSIAHSLVERHDGSIEVTSEGPGKGSCFTVRLPLSEGMPAEASTPIPFRSPARAHNILLVEDNADLRESLAELLREWGHQVRTADNGAQAVEAASSERFDLAFVDLGLPDLNGFEVASRLRAVAGGLRLVALTGFVSDAQRNRAQLAGFDEFVAKPVDLKALEASLARGPDGDDALGAVH
ncbi:MAG: ATP-binding protein [Myxococcales bacterium]